MLSLTDEIIFDLTSWNNHVMTIYMFISDVNRIISGKNKILCKYIIYRRNRINNTRYSVEYRKNNKMK